MIIGIDSSNNKQLICVVFGSNENIYKTYMKLCDLFKQKDWNPPLHWKKMASSVKKALIKPASELINESDLKIWIFETNKPMEVEAKDYYLRKVPNKVAFALEPLIRSTKGVLQIQADKDFEISKTRGTHDFLKYFVSQVSFRLYGSPVKIMESRGDINVCVKTDEFDLRIRAVPMPSGESKAVQLADVILGVYNIDKRKINFRRIKI
ncbi:MAG: hypothetical protein V1911_00460 [Candidatus Micrarchaeota archaeon]